MEVKAFAKINLFLDITGKRADGYHELAMIMQEVGLYDTVTAERADGIYAHADGVDDEHNIAAKAARAFFAAAGIDGGLRISVKKGIPMQAGLGGGSADAAAALKCANELYGFPLSHAELLRVGNTIGADVPFALTGKTAVALGTGDILTPIDNRLAPFYLIIKPEGGVSTARAFALFDEQPQKSSADISLCVRALEAGDASAFSKAAYNALTPAAKLICPGVSSALNVLDGLNGCLCSFMTGSGSACVGMFSNRAQAESAKKAASALGGYRVFLTAGRG